MANNSVETASDLQQCGSPLLKKPAGRTPAAHLFVHRRCLPGRRAHRVVAQQVRRGGGAPSEPAQWPLDQAALEAQTQTILFLQRLRRTKAKRDATPNQQINKRMLWICNFKVCEPKRPHFVIFGGLLGLHYMARGNSKRGAHPPPSAVPPFTVPMDPMGGA